MKQPYSHYHTWLQRFGARLRTVLAGLVLLAGVAGCTPNDEVAPEGADELLCIRASIDESIARASDKGWDKGDSIGVTFRFINSMDSTESLNRKFVTQGGENLFVLGDDGLPLEFTPKIRQIEVSAYYPFMGKVGTSPDSIVRTLTADDQKDAGSRAKIDYLYADAKTSGSTINLSFRHCMARLVINCEKGPGLQDMKDVTCRFTQVCKGTFNPQSGKALATGTDTDTLLVVIPADVKRGEYILFPQPDSIPSLNIPSYFLFSVKMEGKDFVELTKDDADHPLSVLQAGNTYTINLLLDDEVSISSADFITVGNWSEEKDSTDTSSTPSNH